MPPIRSQSASKLEQQEGRLLLAIQALQNKDISSITLAARTFDVPRITLRDCLSGRSQRSTTCANLQKLTETEEESL